VQNYSNYLFCITSYTRFAFSPRYVIVCYIMFYSAMLRCAMVLNVGLRCVLFNCILVCNLELYYVTLLLLCFLLFVMLRCEVLCCVVLLCCPVLCNVVACRKVICSGMFKVFQGNTYRSEDIVTNTLPWHVRARCIRVNPWTWVDWPALRFDVLGCDV